MAALFSGGLLLAFSLLLGLILAMIGMFFGHIILFDSIFFAVIPGVAANKLLHLHPALSLLAGIAILIFLFRVQHTRLGFWIVGGLFSFFWSLFFSMIVVIIMLLHLKAGNKS